MMINPLLTEFPLALYFLDLNGAAKEGVTTLKGVAKVTFTDLVYDAWRARMSR